MAAFENPEFKSFSKIERIGKLYMSITQKIHGTNAQIYIDHNHDCSCEFPHDIKSMVLAGSRTRWLEPCDDNFGFAWWVQANRDELIAKLGEGRHYGEWCGKGINSGEGLQDKKFLLF